MTYVLPSQEKTKYLSAEDFRWTVAPRAFLDQAYHTFESTVTLVKNEGNLILLAGPDRKIAIFSMSSDPGDYFAGRAFIAEMKKRNPGILSFFAAVVAISFGSPHFLRHFPEVEDYVCLCRNTPETQEIPARALFGEMDINGKLPVFLTGLYPVGHGLSMKKAEK
jgi:hypothetical protein